MVAPSLDTLLEIVHACGLDLPLRLEDHAPVDDQRVSELQRSSPERRLGLMLGRAKRETD